jgi:hypothetical protein
MFFQMEGLARVTPSMVFFLKALRIFPATRLFRWQRENGSRGGRAGSATSWGSRCRASCTAGRENRCYSSSCQRGGIPSGRGFRARNRTLCLVTDRRRVSGGAGIASTLWWEISRSRKCRKSRRGSRRGVKILSLVKLLAVDPLGESVFFL